MYTGSNPANNSVPEQNTAWAVFRFFIYSNLFMAVCAVAMVMQTYQLLLRSAPDNTFILFVFFSTISSYSFHWWLTGPSMDRSDRIRWLEKFRHVHLVFLVIGLAGAMVCFYLLRAHWFYLSITGFMTFLYSAPKINHPFFRSLRKVAFGKTIFLALVWTLVTALLPLLIRDVAWKTDYTLFITGRFFLVYAICILFDYRDRDYDKAEGIKSFITYLNEKGINFLFWMSLLIFLVTTCWLYSFDYSLLLVFILLLPGIITALLYGYVKKNFSDILYYFVLDGLMGLSAFIMLIAANWLTLPT